MSPFVRKKLYYLLKQPNLNYDELFKLESLEFKTSVDLEEMSESDIAFINELFLRYCPENLDDFESFLTK